jgi:hypothetical protein
MVPIHHPSVHSSKQSLFSRYATEIPIVRPIIRSFVRSFIVPIHRSSFVHTNYSPLLFIIVTVHRYYSSTLLFNVSIHHYYSSSLLFIDDIYGYYSIITIHRCYSSIVRSTQISTTHPSCCPAHLRPTGPIFQSYKLR